MKRKFASVVIGLSLIAISPVSAQTIYGLQQASQFRSNLPGNFYIQVGSYKNKSNALRAKSQLQAKSSHPIVIKKDSGYLVLVGPFKSDIEVRKSAQILSGISPVIRKAQKTQDSSIHAEQPVIQNNTNNYPVQKNQAKGIYIDKDGVQPLNQWFIGFGAGWMSPFGTDQTNFSPSGIPGFPYDAYVVNNTKTSTQISAFAGYQWRRDSEWIPATSLSFEYIYTFPLSLDGDILVNNLQDSRNFNYKYDISQQIPMAKLKLDLYRWQKFMPYVSGGIGVAFNRVYNYSQNAIPGATLMIKRFGYTSTTTSQFAGSVGAGIDYWINYNSQISLGYELAYYGKARTGGGQGPLNGTRLETNFNSNAVVLKGTYFFS